MLLVWKDRADCETFIHLMPQIKKTKRNLVRKLEKGGIKWQAQVEKRLLADLLANKKAVVSQLRFLKGIDIGRREEAREQEKEWEQRNNQAREELLGEWIKFDKKVELGWKKSQTSGLKRVKTVQKTITKRR